MKHEEQLDKILRDKLEGLNFEYTPDHWAMMQERISMEGLDANPDAFDATMKVKLENIAPTYNPLHWEMMQDAIAAEGLSAEVDPIDELVDDIVRTRLENITPELNPVHWEMMKDAMNAEGMEVELDPVDELLKGKLEQLSFEYNPSHWDTLKERIDQEAYADAKQVDDVLFDASTYGHLSNMEVPYNEEHWKLMKERIDAEFSIRGKMMRYKVAEVALILMIIITAFHYLPIHKKKIKNNAIIANATSVIDKSESNTTRQTDTKAAPSNNKVNYNNNTIASNSVKKNEVSDISNATSSIVDTDVVIENTTSPIANSDTYNVNTSLASNNLYNKTTTIVDQNEIIVAPPTSFTNTPIAKVGQPNSNEVAIAIAESIIANATTAKETVHSAITAMTQVEAVETLQAALLYIDDKENAVGCSTCTELEQKWGLSVGMFSTFDLNYIMTPYDDVFNASAYAQNALGYGGGFSIGFRYNKWEVETGAIYSYKQYAPKPRIEIFSGNLSSGYLGESINDVELNMIKIPLNLKYHFYKKGKWNVYSTGGANLSMAMQANYDKKQYIFTGNAPIGGTVALPSGTVALTETAAKKRFADGILEGGSFLENRYFTANLGFGVERKFNPRWSIFGQPTYQHQLISQGLGPNKDRINTLSILTGARVTF